MEAYKIEHLNKSYADKDKEILMILTYLYLSMKELD